MTEWKKYTGAPEQIEEMMASKYGVLFIHHNGDMTETPVSAKNDLPDHIDQRYGYPPTHYLICNPHPNADMICQQARTGQEVYIKITLRDLDYHISRLIEFFRFVDHGVDWHRAGQFEPGESVIFKTTKPDWNIPGAIYSFTPFED